MRVGIPTDDGLHIFSGMLGRARAFHIYQWEEGKGFSLLEKRVNPYAETMQHLKTLDVYELLKDCGIIVAGKIGKKGMGRLQERGMKLVLRQGGIKEALAELNKGA